MPRLQVLWIAHCRELIVLFKQTINSDFTLYVGTGGGDVDPNVPPNYIASSDSTL